MVFHRLVKSALDAGQRLPYCLNCGGYAFHHKRSLPRLLVLEIEHAISLELSPQATEDCNPRRVTVLKGKGSALAVESPDCRGFA
jgi:hypothetical protein